ncbi:MAG: pyridoxamine 5'-phosphate oxidase family protein [Acidobacteria bacterium]|nr:pyridoxamine 5'-phosphate oxidase family protein [Acidobacteriota bacterium]
MANSKARSQKASAGASVPKADRPHIPGYGVPKGKAGMLAWSHVTERMTAAQNYWITTVSPDGHPHATPVWGLWVDDKLYFGGGVMTKRSRNLNENPAVCVHLESGSDVIILQGAAHPMAKPDAELIARLIDMSGEKYGYKPKPEEYGGPGGFVFYPSMVLAWTQFPKDATRWRFTQEG